MYDRILNILFPQPRICPICGEKQNKLQFCPKCLEKLNERVNALGYCDRCGTFGNQTKECRSCHDWPFDMTNKAAVPYLDEYRQIILDFKFNNKPWLIDGVVSLLPQMKDDIDFVTMVPLSKERKYERGYNQSEVLAKKYAKKWDISFRNDIVIKIKEVPPQSSLSRAERLVNLNQAFSIKNKKAIEGKRILLIDDIITTGTTLKVCGELLYQAGAKDVQCITLAAGVI